MNQVSFKVASWVVFRFIIELKMNNSRLYLSIRYKYGTNLIYNTSISIGSLNEDNSGYYAVAKETKDVILTDKIWTDKILSIFN